MTLTRKNFIRTALVAAGAVAGLGCGSEEPSEGHEPSGDCSAQGSAITDNHSPGHALTVTRTDIEAGGTKVYGMQGQADHDHQVTLTDTHFSKLVLGKTVYVASSQNSGHKHDVALSC